VTGINLNRYKNNDFLNYHTDEWINNPKHFVRYGVIIYYNDNYEGGELHYKDLEIIYRPKAGSLILHEGHMLHGTLPVKSNSVRYSSTFFVKELRGKNISLNKEIFGDTDGL
jgi:predicted 2-oxoglutarate/Fe(II)-dependent dioxygenase YbiX